MTLMRNKIVFAGLLAALAGGAGLGCVDNDRPTQYGRQRPPLDELDPRDRGLQAPDVRRAADEVIMSLLSLPELNDSPRRWTVVISGVEDRTDRPQVPQHGLQHLSREAAGQHPPAGPRADRADREPRPLL